MSTQYNEIIKRINAATNNSALHSADFLMLQWCPQVGEPILLQNMKRSHVQNSLNWCIRKQRGADHIKDGVLMSQWISFFLIRLLDPTLE